MTKLSSTGSGEIGIPTSMFAALPAEGVKISTASIFNLLTYGVEGEGLVGEKELSLLLAKEGYEPVYQPLNEPSEKERYVVVLIFSAYVEGLERSCGGMMELHHPTGRTWLIYPQWLDQKPVNFEYSNEDHMICFFARKM